MPYCIGTGDDGGVGRCAGCRTDADCGSTLPVCEPSKKICVECTAIELAACHSTDKGAVCLANETCGCDADHDCGDATSGRICYLPGHACGPGCRIMGGNGCPDGMVCSEPGSSPGVCMPATDMAIGYNHNDMSRTLSLTGGGGCDYGGRGDSPSETGLVLLAVALVLWARRRFRNAG
jgi:hypothetical protein